MFLVFNLRRSFWYYALFALFLFLLGFNLSTIWIHYFTPAKALSENEVFNLISRIFHLRNQAILEKNLPALSALYNQSTRNGIWAYEHQVKKMKYLHKWCFKQGVKFSAIKSLIRLRRVNQAQVIRITLLASTEYQYSYIDKPNTINLMRIGTYHSLVLSQNGDLWQISREWYTDPFADALAMKEQDTLTGRDFILAQNLRVFSGVNPKRLKAVAYADEFCGAAANEEQGFKYNPKYKNYNYSGGDCANFASQILHEGGGFRKNPVWNYGKGASRAWVNAQAFNRYLLNSGRASRIAYGTYSQVLKASYQLLHGDYIAYEKKGKVTHISVVTGADSKGYAVTNSHNADRYRVPWDLGYGDKGIRFWLVRVHYD